jgi:hypothetical protein
MVVAKVSVSVGAELLAEARELAGRRGLSALINDSLRIRLHHARVESAPRRDGRGVRAGPRRGRGGGPQDVASSRSLPQRLFSIPARSSAGPEVTRGPGPSFVRPSRGDLRTLLADQPSIEVHAV